MAQTVDRTTEYARAIVAGRKICCRAEMDACRRHLRDLSNPEFEWRPEEAERHIEFANMLSYYDDIDRVVKPLHTRGFQNFIIGNIFGWYRKTGYRRYSQAYIQVARKNSKSFLSGFFCLDFAMLSGVPDGQIYCAGTKFDDAKITFDEVKKFIKYDKDLQEYFKIKEYNNSTSRIVNVKNGTIIRPLSGLDERDGWKPLYNSVDEYHLHKTPAMMKVLLDGQIGYPNSLTTVITTAGFDLNRPCYQQYLFAKKVAAGTIEADFLFVYIAEMDLPDPHTEPEAYEAALWDEQNWAKANPLKLFDDDYNITTNETKWQDFRDSAKMAKEKGGFDLTDFLVKQVNVWTTLGSSAYISPSDWSDCGKQGLLLTKFKKCRIHLGFDLSSKNDLASMTITVPPQDIPGTNETLEKPYIWSHSYLPKNTLQRHITQDKAPYDQWVRKGLLTLTDCGGTNGFILDYKFILEDLRSILTDNEFKVISVGYDPMGMSGMIADLEEICGPDAELIEIVQNPKSLNDATRSFRDTVKGQGVLYDLDNDLLTWSIVNAVVVVNSKKELLIDKKTAGNRIDPVDSVLDCWKVCMLADDLERKAAKEAATVDEWLDLMDKF